MYVIVEYNCNVYNLDHYCRIHILKDSDSGHFVIAGDLAPGDTTRVIGEYATVDAALEGSRQITEGIVKGLSYVVLKSDKDLSDEDRRYCPFPDDDD